MVAESAIREQRALSLNLEGDEAMRQKDLKIGMAVKIAEGHESGYGGRIGYVVKVGEFKSYDGLLKVEGAKIDIQEPLLVIVESEHLEPVAKENLPKGWAEYDL